MRISLVKMLPQHPAAFLLMLTLTQSSLGLPANTTETLFRGRYLGYSVLSITPRSQADLDWLVELRAGQISKTCALDWWSEITRPDVPVSVAVNPDCEAKIVKNLKAAGIEYKTVIKDLEEVIKQEQDYRFIAQSLRDPSQWNPEVYHPLDEIKAYIQWLVSNHSDLVSTETLKTTYEGRNIDVVIVRQPGPVTKPVIWLDCGIHAREWVSPPACLHAITELVQSANSLDPEEDLLSLYDFYIVPVSNPDGYVYTWESDRMWRKNRRPVRSSGTSSARCSHGVDPNRNFPNNFYSLEGASNNPCDDSYHGVEPFSEAESLAVKQGVELMKSRYGEDRIAAFISIHAYSQFWMSPYGYKRTKPADYADHMRVMKKSVDALRQVHNTVFTFGPIAEIIYIASGSSIDWAYEDENIKYSFGLELRDTGRWGFLLPQDQIIPTITETWAGIKALALAVSKEFKVSKLL